MRTARLGMLALALVALLLGTSLTGPPAQAAGGSLVLAVGDSVPAGMRCSCTAFPARYAAAVAAHTGRALRAANYAESGDTSDDTLSQVNAWGRGGAMGASSTVLVMVGANDFGPVFDQVLDGQRRAIYAFPPVANRVRANVTAIIRRLQSLHPGIHVVVLDYWNVMKDGAVARRVYGDWGMAKAAQATVYANAALHQAATATGATFVSSRTALKGPSGTSDPTRFLVWDGDHPNAAGHAAIAAAIYRARPAG